jgi:thiamine transporter
MVFRNAMLSLLAQTKEDFFMNNFFATPTDVWGDNAVVLTTAGIFIIIAAILILVGIALAVYRLTSGTKTAQITTKQLVFSAMAMALATVTSMIKLGELPMGGSVTLLSMLFIVLIAYWYGPVAGITTGMAYGLLQFVLEPIFYTIPQMLVDYPLAFGALGLAGFFCNKKYGLQIGYVVGVLGRFVFAFLSGVLFFASYAPEGMNPALYSTLYNGSYLLAEAVLTLVIISIPPVYKALGHTRRLALAE